MDTQRSQDSNASFADIAVVSPWMVAYVWTMGILAIAAIVLSHTFLSSEPFRVEFGQWLFNNPLAVNEDLGSRPNVGWLVHIGRVVLLMIAFGSLNGIIFKAEFRTIFSRSKYKEADAPAQTRVRWIWGVGLVLTLAAIALLYYHHLYTGPRLLESQWLKHVELYGLSYRPQIASSWWWDDYHRPYVIYFIYTLIASIGFGVPLYAVAVYLVRSDIKRLYEIGATINRTKQHYNSGVYEDFCRQFHNLKNHTIDILRRHTYVLIPVTVMTAYESILGQYISTKMGLVLAAVGYILFAIALLVLLRAIYYYQLVFDIGYEALSKANEPQERLISFDQDYCALSVWNSARQRDAIMNFAIVMFFVLLTVGMLL